MGREACSAGSSDGESAVGRLKRFNDIFNY